MIGSDAAKPGVHVCPPTVLAIDLQERLVPAVADSLRIVDRATRLVQAARHFGWRILATEHVADRIGVTVAPLLSRLEPAERVAKRHFDAFKEAGFADRLREGGQRPVPLIVVGTETHVCVALTVLSALEAGHPVTVVADGVGSRDPANRTLALDRMKAAGAAVWPLETVLFDGLGSADHPAFRTILELIKPLAPAAETGAPIRPSEGEAPA